MKYHYYYSKNKFDVLTKRKFKHFKERKVFLENRWIPFTHASLDGSDEDIWSDSIYLGSSNQRTRLSEKENR